MIVGRVTASIEAVVTITVIGPISARFEVSATIDTGFSEYLSLPPSVISALNLAFKGYSAMELADGSFVRVPAFDVQVEWHGQTRDIIVHESEGGILLGMGLLKGSRVVLDVTDGGAVEISPLL